MKIRISIVVYKPDISLLSSVIHSVFTAFLNFSCELRNFNIDIINNAYDELPKQALNDFPAPWLDQINVTFSGGNVGYGIANNISILNHHSDFHLVLNPDALLSPDFFTQSINFLNTHQEVGLLVPKVIGFDENIQYLCKNNPDFLTMILRSFAPQFIKRMFKRRLDKFEMRDHDYSKPISPIYFPSGCCMLFKTSIIQSIGGFDDRFFMYFEDADLGRRLNKVSTVVYYPHAVVKHKWERATHKSLKYKIITIKSALQYHLKWGFF